MRARNSSRAVHYSSSRPAATRRSCLTGSRVAVDHRSEATCSMHRACADPSCATTCCCCCWLSCICCPQAGRRVCRQPLEHAHTAHGSHFLRARLWPPVCLPELRHSLDGALLRDLGARAQQPAAVRPGQHARQFAVLHASTDNGAVLHASTTRMVLSCTACRTGHAVVRGLLCGVP